MFSHLTREDRLAIFQKFSPVSFSRVIRTCKWVHQFVDDNKRKIKIQTDKRLLFTGSFSRASVAGSERVIKMMSAERVVLKEIHCKSREYEAILADPRFHCLVFAEVEDTEYGDISLQDEIDIRNLPPSALDSAFDLAESNRNKIVEQKIVIERIYISGGFSGEENPPEMLTCFLEVMKSATMVLADEFKIYFIPVTEKTFLAVYWYLNKGALNETKLISSRETLYEHVIELSGWWNGTGERLTAEEVRSLPFVQEICNRFFP